ncbi:hypothetical protein [Methylorubrum podarium]|jgi:hypothetical protein|uniref:hypothetical protein n=1 Tax=Methylorubrum podarium TaxID=200476 RepID=UPI001EE16E56|nr:hypothetical protein [Methylorubrum podarium]
MTERSALQETGDGGQAALQALLSHHRDAKNAKVYKSVRYGLNGRIYLIEFQHADGSSGEWAIWSDGRTSYVSRDIEQLSDFVSSHPSIWERISDPGFVSAFIAMFMIVFITILYAGKTEVNQVLTGAMTLVLGFYFGRKT